MRNSSFVFPVAVLFVIWNINTVFSQITLPPQIENLNKDTILYCSDSILVTPEISIKNIEIDEPSEGMKISIANYKKGEDILTFREHPQFDYFWDTNYGSLLIRGVGTASEYQEAVRDVYYKNISTVPNLETRSFSISLLDADYLPSTRHFYRFVKNRGIKWTDARNQADTMNYYGLKGYLATITSKNENDFIWTKIDGIGWIGANDSLSEGTWKWVAGPEKGTVFWQGNYNGSPVNGEYSFWNTGEPNNVQKSWGDDEDYAHINSNPNTIPKSWNDLPNEGDKHNPDGYYFPQGFIVEFGGMEGDPEVKLSATAQIKVSKIAFSDERDFTICKGDIQELNLEADAHYNYLWAPAGNINSTTISNPLVSPPATSIYMAIGKLDNCIDTASFKVTVHPVPKHTWDNVNVICQGASVQLNPGDHDSYLWENLDTTQTLTVSKEGFYTVKITNEYGCNSKDSTLVKWAEIPRLDYSRTDTLVCGKKSQKLNLSFQNGSAETILSAITPGGLVSDESTLFPLITVNSFGKYRFQMDLVDQYQCSFTDTIEIEFHNQPDAQFQIDDAECEGYNLKLYYDAQIFEDAMFNWYSNDTLFYAGINADTMEIPLGYGTFNRSVGLKINEKGCTDSLRLPVTVTPVLDFWPEKSKGCTPLHVQFNFDATETVKDFLWDFGDGITSTEKKPFHIFENQNQNTKEYSVGLKIISAEGCENSGLLTNAVTVYPIPTIDLSFSEQICNNDSVEIWYKGSANASDNYFWDLNDFQKKEVLNNPGNAAGPLIVKMETKPLINVGLQVVSAFGCKTDTISKKLKRKPVFNVVIENAEGCAPFTTSFFANTIDAVDEVSYGWDYGDGTIGFGEKTEKSYLEKDKKFDIQVMAKSEVTGCSDTLILKERIFSYPIPTALFEANPPTVLISNPVIQFNNLSEFADNYLWNFGDETMPSSLENPEHEFNTMGFFDVELKAKNDFGCTDSIVQQVSVAFDKLFPPSAFSPHDALEENREFRIHSIGILDEGYRLLVFNRWGEVIFESRNPAFGWDGKMRTGKYAPAGVYTYVVEYLDFRKERFKQHGTVTLLF